MGAPLGNQNAAKGKRWTAAIERVLERWPEKPTTDDKSPLIVGIESAAYDFISETKEKKDLGYFKELGDRLEGKPNQALDIGVTADEDNPLNKLVSASHELALKLKGM